MSERDYSPHDLKMLGHLSERVVNDAEWAGRRLVVEVWDRADHEPVAWIEFYPGDSSPAIRFHPGAAPGRADNAEEDDRDAPE